MYTPLVSIIVPIYKVEPYLRRCVDSIVCQTYTNLEIILVDDGSPDTCPQICDEYANKDKRIVVIHKKNGGLSDARNAGLNSCKGEYISFIDSDDYVDYDFIESLIEPIKKNSYDFVIADHLSSNEKKGSMHLSCKEGPIQDNLKIIRTYCSQQYPPSAWAKLYKFSFLKNNQFHFQKGLLFEDQLWSCILACSAERIFVIRKQIYHYTIRMDSIMQSSNIDFFKRLSAWCFILDKEQEALSAYKIKLKKTHSLFFINKITEVLKISNGQKEYFKTAFRAIKKSMKKNPAVFWFRQTTGLEKIFFSLLLISPSFLAEEAMFFYLKYRKCIRL